MEVLAFTICPISVRMPHLNLMSRLKDTQVNKFILFIIKWAGIKLLFLIYSIGEITCLSWDPSEGQVASGSKDSRVIVWDVVSETGLLKFTEHKGIITRIRYWNCKDEQFLVTSSFDTTIRIWSIATKLNVHTIPCTIQIRDFEIHNDVFIIAEANIKLFRVTYNAEESYDAWQTDEMGILLRHSHDRPARTQLIDGTGVMMVVGVKSPVIEVFRFSSDEQAAKRRAKRLKKNPADEQTLILKDIVRRGETFKASEEKIKSITAVYEKGMIKVIL